MSEINPRLFFDEGFREAIRELVESEGDNKQL